MVSSNESAKCIVEREEIKSLKVESVGHDWVGIPHAVYGVSGSQDRGGLDQPAWRKSHTGSPLVDRHGPAVGPPAWRCEKSTHDTTWGWAGRDEVSVREHHRPRGNCRASGDVPGEGP